MRRAFWAALYLAAMASLASAQAPQSPHAPDALEATYVLGPGDELVIRALDAEEIAEKPVRIDLAGYIRLPLVGRVKAGGLTVEQLTAELTTRLKQYILEPDVAVSVVQFRSQPVSVIGAVKSPGVVQLEGRKTLVEILSQAGGLAPEAGYTVTITRRLEYGRIPLPQARDDESGRYSIAEIELNPVMEARNPQGNIEIRPYDVISVPRADLVYVIGQVKRSGGFALKEKESITVLQALALAEGLEKVSAPQAARILRQPPGGGQRVEIAVNVKHILEGKAPDIPLQAQDILFIPISAAKAATLRAVEAAISIGTGVVVYRRW
jgi:polysaccharide export outer membrane protein